MNINNRALAAIFRIMAAFISIYAILNDFNIFYFTTISNLLCFLMFLFLSIKTLVELKQYGKDGSTSISPHIKGGITVAIILTMSVYHFILIPYALSQDPLRRLNLNEIILHYIVPCLTILDWILFDEKKRFKFYDPVIWTVIPIVYVAFVFVQAIFNFVYNLNIGMSKYIYIFFDIEVLGKNVVWENILKLSAFFLLVGYFIYGIDRIRIKKDEKILEKI